MRPWRVHALIALVAFQLCSLTDAAKKFDHQSHAVISGKDKTVKDYDDDGFAEVELNGELSHSHFFNPENASDIGRIVEYKWTESRLNATIGTSVSFKHNFPVGETIVTLFVRDHMNDTSTTSVKVNVEPSGTQGAYFYYYDMSGIIAKPWILSVIDQHEHKPKFGGPVSAVDFYDDKWPTLPETIDKGPFTIQVMARFLALRDDHYEFSIALANGFASLFVNGKQVAWYHNNGDSIAVTNSETTYLGQGKHDIQLRYYTDDLTSPKCILGVIQNNETIVVTEDMLSYKAMDVVPTIHQATPLKSTLGGGGKMTIHGAGFYGNVDVLFGDELGWNIDVKDSKKIVLNIPKVEEADDILLSLKTRKGESNALPFSYNKAAPMPIKFKESFVTYPNGTIFPSKQFSSVALGPDMRYYFGSLDSHVHVVAIKHASMTVDSVCKSVGMGMGRTVAGVAFNPADTTLRVYISTNMFYWRNYYSIPDEQGWHNGKVQTLIKGSSKDGACLIHEKDLITGLPVSNHDHGVNSLIFDNDGNLYMQIGGSTNAGVSLPDDLVGGVKESELSSATIVAHLREPGFNGTITYDRYDDPELAVPLTPKRFLEGFAYGFRNSFGSVYHTSGNIFATDNGPNEGYGASSTSCNTTGPDPWNSDTLVLVQKGSYFGYPNRARGKRGDERQCVYYAPQDEASKGFTPPLAVFEASTNGIIEYTANCFEGQMKGDLLISKYAVQGKGKLFRAQLDATKKALKGSVEDFRDFSGLSIVMNPYGALVMPRVQQPNIAVLSPDEEATEGNEPKFTAVSPHRGPRRGGNWVIITGERLSKKPKIMFGDKQCTLLKVDEDEERWALCVVPKGKGSVTISITTSHGKVTTKYPDYHYMSY